MQAGGEGILQFDLGYTKHFNPNEIAATVSDAEAIVFVGGISPKVEGEELPVSFPLTDTFTFPVDVHSIGVSVGKITSLRNEV